MDGYLQETSFIPSSTDKMEYTSVSVISAASPAHRGSRPFHFRVPQMIKLPGLAEFPQKVLGRFIAHQKVLGYRFGFRFGFVR
jgi:hypothetical protein